MRKTDIEKRKCLEKLTLNDIKRIMEHSVSTCERYQRSGDLDQMDLFYELICDAFCVGYMMGNRAERLSGNRGKSRA